MSKGYIYVLANSSMPELVKIGKTTRQPRDRAQELSKVTGVPTPFIVVYEKLVEDPDAVESFVHEVLARKGYKVAENREFFSSPVAEVIDAIIQAIDSLKRSNKDANKNVSNINGDVPVHAWMGIWKQANDFFYGEEDCLEDASEALKLFKKATKLGCYLAYERIAVIYFHGLVGPVNYNEALKVCKEGVAKGNYVCHIWMARVFINLDKIENSRKCILNFIGDRSGNMDELIEENIPTINHLVHAIANYFILAMPPDEEVKNNLLEVRLEFMKELDDILDFFKKNNAPKIKEYLRLKDWMLL